MKKTGLLFLALFSFTVSNSQTVLKFESHAFKPGVHNSMAYCSYLKPGSAGANVFWDFSELRFKKSFEGLLNESEHSEYGRLFSESNIELSEFDSRFFFKVSEEKMEQYGYSNADGKNQIHFFTPFVKIKFPFAYHDAFSGIVAGTSANNGIINSTITGSYLVEADAYGTLVLPGNTIYENTLRIRTEKKYINHYVNIDQEVVVVTYRWYNDAHRYPLLVLTKYTTKTEQTEHTNYQAAYNVNALKSVIRFYGEDVKLYPNPSTKDLHVRINTLSEGSYQFNIFDASGKLIRTFFMEASAVGLHDFDISDKISGLKPAVYTLMISNGSSNISKRFVLMG